MRSKHINWQEEVAKRKASIVADVQRFLQMKSVLDESTSGPNAPFGEGIKEALEFLLKMGENDGFPVKNVDGYAGHIEWGSGNDLIGVLCHIDVVPEGDGWTSDPYGAEIRDGSIYARGALDDKGPTIAAYYALKIVKELGLELKKRVRIIIGTDEESDWRCVEHYFKKEEMPTIGFAPDADFPIIYAEKGIVDVKLKYEETAENAKRENEITLKHFHSGQRLNMVSDYAEATLSVENSVEEVARNFYKYIQSEGMEGSASTNGNEITLTTKGVSAHGMEPDNGVNAGLKLISFLNKKTASKLVTFIHDYFSKDSRGHALQIAKKDDVSGELTINVGIIRYEQNTGGELGLNIRYPVTTKSDNLTKLIREQAESFSFHVASIDDSEPHYVKEDHPLIKKLSYVYEQQTGEKAQLLAIGGGTYARSLTSGVAFGPLFPNRPDVAHQKDENIRIDDLLTATAIYAQAIFELCKD